MKKNLLALAALTLVSGAAFAQSSVTLYGVADVGIGKEAGKKVGMMSGTYINHATSGHAGIVGGNALSADCSGGMFAGADRAGRRGGGVCRVLDAAAHLL